MSTREEGTATTAGLTVQDAASTHQLSPSPQPAASQQFTSQPHAAQPPRIEPPATAETSTDAKHRCANCGALVSGRYCAECGQRVEHSLHSLWHFIGEAAEDLTHADSRLWRTLAALFFKPGFLTREFLDGRRMSYLPPLRLYLVLSVLFFLIAALTSQPSTPDFRQVRIHVNANNVAVERPAQEPGVARQQALQACNNLSYSGPWKSRLLPAFRTSCARAVEDGGRQLHESFMHNLPRAIFLTVPILALFLKPLYWRPRRYYVEHVLFLLHDHAFLFVLLGLFSIVTALLHVHALVDALGILAGLYVPWYYYVAMRRVYEQSPGRTLGKLAVLVLAYLIAAVGVLLATSLYTVVAE
jgi:hypothetical protein